MTGVSFGYAEHPVVSGVALRVDSGEVVAILGPNGSGKSTIVKGLLGLATAFSGTVELFGHPPEQLPDRSRIGYVPQRHTVAGTVRSSVREVVATGRLTSRPWWARHARRDEEAVSRALQVVGLSDRAGVDLSELSGGQQRRALIARALAGEPDLLVLDEPTAGVDIGHQHALSEVLRRLAATGVTMLIVTHELAALADIVTRVIVVDGGRVTFDGSRDDFAEHAAAVWHDHGYHHHESPSEPAAAVLGSAAATLFPGLHVDPLPRRSPQ